MKSSGIKTDAGNNKKKNSSILKIIERERGKNVTWNEENNIVNVIDNDPSFIDDDEIDEVDDKFFINSPFILIHSFVTNFYLSCALFSSDEEYIRKDILCDNLIGVVLSIIKELGDSFDNISIFSLSHDITMFIKEKARVTKSMVTLFSSTKNDVNRDVREIIAVIILHLIYSHFLTVDDLKDFILKRGVIKFDLFESIVSDIKRNKCI